MASGRVHHAPSIPAASRTRTNTITAAGTPPPSASTSLEPASVPARTQKPGRRRRWPPWLVARACSLHPFRCSARRRSTRLPRRLRRRGPRSGRPWVPPRPGRRPCLSWRVVAAGASRAVNGGVVDRPCTPRANRPSRLAATPHQTALRFFAPWSPSRNELLMVGHDDLHLQNPTTTTRPGVQRVF